ncbi:hypothetical protein [Roseibium album]|uniref:hypothetical protein n=1 Tax=Roseibium album TaxID=311410 RepID=UPI002491379A|nr:hypothetical protein [Roseibium album]
MTKRIAKTIDRGCEDLEFAFVAELVGRQGAIQAPRDISGEQMAFNIAFGGCHLFDWKPARA